MLPDGATLAEGDGAVDAAGLADGAVDGDGDAEGAGLALGAGDPDAGAPDADAAADPLDDAVAEG